MTVRKIFANKSGESLVGYEGYAVEFETDGLSLCDAITDCAIGIVTRGGATESEVCIFGECEAKTYAALTAGTYLIPHTDGTVKTSSGTAQEFALALAATPAGAFGIVFVYGSSNNH
jgi:hypothetical protein